MDGWLFLRGMLIGLSIAAPVGPIGVLVIRRTLAQGWGVGLASGAGVASADALYGCVAGFGLTAISGALLGAQAFVRLAGGLFLCYLGVRTLLAEPAERPAGAAGRTLLSAYASTLLLTITNPLTIISFLAVLASLGVGGGEASYAAALLVVAGVFCGSLLWWLLLSGATSLLRARLSPAALRWVNRVSGAIVLGFGFASLYGIFR
jgi:threonine/homoserine/homoserine lactone efflux protein